MDAGQVRRRTVIRERGPEPTSRLGVGRERAHAIGPPRAIVFVQVLQQRERRNVRVERDLDRRAIEPIDDLRVITDE